MVGYQIFLLSGDDHVVARVEVERSSDSDALNEALRQMSAQPRDSHVTASEIWAGGTIVSRVDCRGTIDR